MVSRSNDVLGIFLGRNCRGRFHGLSDASRRASVSMSNESGTVSK